MAEPLNCWKCGATLTDYHKPWSRRAECPACHADVHVCRMCREYNPRVSDKCSETKAEHPREDDRANFCDYFEPNPHAFTGRDARAESAKMELDALFGKKD